MWDFLSRHTKGIACFESNYFVFSRCTDENLQYPAKIFHLEISRLYLNDKFTKEVVLEFFNRSLCNRGSNRFWRHSFLEIWVCRYSADKQNMAESLSFSTGPNDIHTMVSAILPNTLFDKKNCILKSWMVIPFDKNFLSRFKSSDSPHCWQFYKCF